MGSTDTTGNPRLPKGIETFNEQLAKELAQGGLEPISATEIASDAPESHPMVKPYVQSDEVRSLMMEPKQLRFDTNGGRRQVAI
jgi:hypothetical protein